MTFDEYIEDLQSQARNKEALADLCSSRYLETGNTEFVSKGLQYIREKSQLELKIADLKRKHKTS